MIALRMTYFYEDSFDDRYWDGGIQKLLDIEKLKNLQLNDPTSRLLLLFNAEHSLVAYSRFSINEKQINSYHVSRLHIFIAEKELLGNKILIDGELISAGKFMLQRVIAICEDQNSDILISEISVFPFPNLPSLILHKKFGFLPCTDFIKESKRDDGGINAYLVLGKCLGGHKKIMFSITEI
jgi:hypothetical protein